MDTSLAIKIDPAALLSNDILQELIFQSIDRLIGKPHTIITRDLPFGDHYILAQNAQKQVALITFDLTDGGRALLAALAGLDHLKQHRAWLFRLYPSLFEERSGQQRALRVEDIQIIVVAPKPPPGHELLCKAMPQLSLFTFQALEIDGEIGLLLSAVDKETRLEVNHPSSKDTDLEPFRPTLAALNNEEEAFFHELNI